MCCAANLQATWFGCVWNSQVSTLSSAQQEIVAQLLTGHSYANYPVSAALKQYGAGLFSCWDHFLYSWLPAFLSNVDAMWERYVSGSCLNRHSPQRHGESGIKGLVQVFCFQSLSSIVAHTISPFRYTLYSFSQTQRLWNSSVTRWVCLRLM